MDEEPRRLPARVGSGAWLASREAVGVGSKVWFDKRAWTIVGTFEAPGTVMEAEAWCPLRDLQIAAKRDNLSCVVLTLDGDAEFADVDAFCKQRLDLELVAMRETDYYDALSDFFRRGACAQ